MWGLLVLLAAGCVDTLDEGAVRICPGEEGATDTWSGGPGTEIAVEGTLVGLDDASTDCERSFTVQDADGQAWSFGVTLLDQDGAPVDPGGWDLVEGDAVQVDWHGGITWGWEGGLVLRDDAGVVLAAETSALGDWLAPEDLDGLVVSTGDPAGRRSMDCGHLQGHRIVFETDQDRVDLRPVDAAPLQLGGVVVDAWALASTEYVPGRNCTVLDLNGHQDWAAWRPVLR